MSREPTRIDGYAPIEEYAAIGNRRAVALVALDGAIDWLCLPRMDAPSVFAALLDPHVGGRFELRPVGPFTAERRYVPETNVLETTFTTAAGRVRVADALNLDQGGPLPWTELVRRVEGLEGEVPVRWRIDPRLDYGRVRPAPVRTGELIALRAGPETIAVQSFGLGDPGEDPAGGLAGQATVRAGERHLLAMNTFGGGQPVLRCERDDLEARLDGTAAFWTDRARRATYDGPWRDAVVRSALALDLLADAGTGAIAAAGTTSLPERVGSGRTFDYRFGWLRDMTFTLNALLGLGMRADVQASLGWVLRASRRTHPRLQPFYGLDGEARVPPVELPLSGYRGSGPVLAGNKAATQMQLGNFGDLLETSLLWTQDGHGLGYEHGQQLADVADFVTRVWRDSDAGIWELADDQQYTQGKLAAWIALDRAVRLAEAGHIPDDSVTRWRQEGRAVRRFIEERCWSEAQRSYTFYAGSEELDASVLLASPAGFTEPAGERMRGTIDAIRRELGHGALVYRYSGMQDQENCFVACSFWVVEALARAGRRDEAAHAMDELVGLANDVGLYAEQIDPSSHAHLGNFPQALSHLALLNAALAIEDPAQAPL